MFYLKSAGDEYLQSFNNLGAQLTIFRRDRLHFNSEEEAELVARIVLDRVGLLSPETEDACWVLSYFAWQFTRLYSQFFAPQGSINSRYYSNHAAWEWEAPTKGRCDRVRLNVDEFSLTFNPHATVQFRVVNAALLQGTWTGLNTVFVDPGVRRQIERFCFDFWAILQPYRVSLGQFMEHGK